MWFPSRPFPLSLSKAGGKVGDTSHSGERVLLVFRKEGKEGKKEGKFATSLCRTFSIRIGGGFGSQDGIEIEDLLSIH